MTLVLSSFQKFRIVKIHLKDGAWLTLPRTYSKAVDLIADVLPYRLEGVFTGVSTWYNPLSLEFSFNGEPSVNPEKPIFLKSELVVDIDDEDCEEKFSYSPEIVKDSLMEGLKVKLVLDSREDLRFVKHLRSGGGFHLVYEVVKNPIVTDSNERFEWYRQHKKTVCDSLVNQGLKIDYGPSTNIYGVTRMEGSPHLSGEVCRRINYTGIASADKLYILIKEQLSRFIKSEPKPRIVVDEKHPVGTTTYGVVAETQATKPNLLSKAGSQDYFVRRSVTNNVTGMKDAFVTYFELPKTASTFLKLRRLQETYLLGDLYVSEAPLGKVGVLSLKVVSASRLLKILKAAGVCSDTFKKYKQVWIPLDDFDSGRNRVCDYRPLKVLHSDKKVDGVFSSYHAAVFGIKLNGGLKTRLVPLKSRIQIRRAE